MKDWEEFIKNVEPIESNEYVYLPNKKPKIGFKDVDYKQKGTDFVFSEIKGGGNITKELREKIKKDRLEINVEIDFHGETLDSAYREFMQSIEKFFKQNMRNFVVVTGKSGLIVREFKSWCKTNPRIYYVCPNEETNTPGSWMVILHDTQSD